MSKTCLITGGAGNLACQLTWRLAAKFDHLLLVDLAARPIAASHPAARFVSADVLDEPALRALFARHRPDVVIHLASLLSGSCERDRRLAWRVNCDGLLGLLELSLEHGVGTLLFPSSIASYGGAASQSLARGGGPVARWALWRNENRGRAIGSLLSAKRTGSISARCGCRWSFRAMHLPERPVLMPHERSSKPSSAVALLFRSGHGLAYR